MADKDSQLRVKGSGKDNRHVSQTASSPRWVVFRCKRVLLRLILKAPLLVFILCVVTVPILLRHYNSTYTSQSRLGNKLFNTPAGSIVTEKSGYARHVTEPTFKTGKEASQSQPAANSSTQASRLFAQKYTNHYTENDTEFLIDLAVIQKQKWKPSLQAKNFRNDLRAALGNSGRLDNFVLTKHDTQPGAKMKFYRHNASVIISDEFWRSLPNVTFYRPGLFRSCSVVGSSGILNGSRCGNHIDKAEFVFRFNLAEVKAYEEDVGSKTNFTTLNPSLVSKTYNSLKKPDDCVRFEALLKQFQGSHLWLSAFSSKWHFKRIVKVEKFAEKYGTVTPIFGHPDHYTAVQNLWKRTLNGTRWITSGLYVMTSIFDLCDQINVYGFWPFPKLLDGKDVPYHYHNKLKVTKRHSFNKEFKALVHLHEIGIIKLHMGSCL